MNFKQKYIKYKNKYLNLKKKLLGGSNEAQIDGMLYQGPYIYTLDIMSENDIKNKNPTKIIKIIKSSNENESIFINRPDMCKFLLKSQKNNPDLQLLSRNLNIDPNIFQLYPKKDLVQIFNYKNPKTVNYLHKENYEKFLDLAINKYVKNNEDVNHPEFYKFLDLLPKKNIVLFKFPLENKEELATVSNFKEFIKIYQENKYTVGQIGKKGEDEEYNEDEEYDKVFEVRKQPDSAVKPPRP